MNVWASRGAGCSRCGRHNLSFLGRYRVVVRLGVQRHGARLGDSCWEWTVGMGMGVVVPVFVLFGTDTLAAASSLRKRSQDCRVVDFSPLLFPSR